VANAAEARDWIKGLRVVDVISYNDGGFNVITAKFSETGSNLASVSCAPTASHLIASHWTSKQFTPAVQVWFSTLLSAQAQDMYVDILVDIANCNQGSVYDFYGSPNGLGVGLWGVRASKE
jgi:hypothetical protein